MKSNIKIDGVDNVMRKYVKFVKDTNSKAGPILQSAVEILKEEAKARVPVSKFGKKKGKWAHPPGTLRDSIEVGSIYRSRYSVSAAAGIAKNRYFTQADVGNMWYGRWVEFGTKERTVKHWWGRKYSHSAGTMRAQPFMRPALKVSRAKIRNLVQKRLKEELFNA